LNSWPYQLGTFSAEGKLISASAVNCQ